MQITPLELGLAAAVVAVVFGPKSLPSFKRSNTADQIEIVSMRPSQNAAARAPSPLTQASAQARTAASTPPPAQRVAPTPPPPAPVHQEQYAMVGSAQPLKMPDQF